MATAHGPSATARGQDALVDPRGRVRDRDMGRLGIGLGTTAQGPRGAQECYEGQVMKIKTIPLELREANAHIEEHHRHHGRVQGHRFSIGVVDETGKLLGCAVVGRPTSGLDPKRILEVTRLCSDGTPNICSMLYSAAARVGKALGYEVIQTYIFQSEFGSSLKASGWKYERVAHPSGRHRKRSDGQARNTEFVEVSKTLWTKQLNGDECNKAFAHHRRKQSDATLTRGNT